MLFIKVKENGQEINPQYIGEVLNLPASRSMMVDALERAGVPYGSGEYEIYPIGTTPETVRQLLYREDDSPSLMELNELASRMAALSGIGLEKKKELRYTESLDNLFAIIEAREKYTIKDFINATYNTGKYSFYAGDWDYKTLGDMALDMWDEYFPELDTLPDDLIECLDLDKLGKLVQKKESGIFTSYGYLIPESTEWHEVYDGKSLADRAVTLPENTPVISLNLSAGEKNAANAWLHCPFTAENLNQAMEKAGIQDATKCHVLQVESLIAPLEFTLSQQSLDDINTLAKELSGLDHSGYMKFKAALELEEPVEMESVIEIAQTLDKYTLLPLPKPPPADPKFEKAGKRLGVNSNVIQQYKMTMEIENLSDQGYQRTSYGYLLREPEQSLEVQQQATPEQSMGGM